MQPHQQEQEEDSSLVVGNTSNVKPPIEINSKDLTWFQRTFKPLTKGGIRASIISLCATTFGTGLLGLPFIASKQGLLIALFLIVVSALYSLLAMYLLLSAGIRLNLKSYGELVNFSLGPKYAQAFEVVLILYCFGACVSNQIAFHEFIWNVFSYLPEQKVIFSLIVQIIFSSTNIFVSLQKSLHSLRHFTVIGIVSIFYILFAMAFYYFQLPVKGQMNESVFDYHLPQSFAITLFSFVSHQVIFQVKNEVVRPTPERIEKIITRTTLVQVIVICSVTYFGYLTFGDNVQPLILNNYDGSLFLIAKLAISVTLYFGVPLNLFPTRNSCLTLLKMQDDENAFMIITFAIQVLSGLIAVVYPQITSAFGLLGGFLGSIIVLLLPGVIQFKLGQKNDLIKGFILGIMVFGTLIGWIGAYMSQL